jgi:segregation and condensation protein B
MARRAKTKETTDYDRELADLPPPLRRREFMMRVEAVIFAASRPVRRETLAPLIGGDCSIDQLIVDIRDELGSRPYELAEVAGGFQYRTRPGYAAIIRASAAADVKPFDLSPLEQLVLTAIAYFQPITRMQVAELLGKPISREVIGSLRSFGLVATGPRRPQPGGPFTYVTTPGFLELNGLPSLRDLPDLDRLEEAGLLARAPLPHELRSALGIIDGDAEETDGQTQDDVELPMFDETEDGGS